MSLGASNGAARGRPPLLYVSEETVRALVGQRDVTEAVAEAFKSHVRNSASNFPVVREGLGHAGAIFGFKSGFDREHKVLGIKAGGLWPGNAASGLPNHQSTTMLFDPDSGAPVALIGTTYLTALRTAAASALSIRVLARPDARVLGLVGAGGQGEAQVLAALAERPFDRVLVADRQPEAEEKLVRRLRDRGVAASVQDVATLCRECDVLITVTPSREPLFAEGVVRPGTHLACMGADTAGKQEVPAGLVARSRLFGDEPEQAIAIGESRHAFREGLIAIEAVVPLGRVLAGEMPGREDSEEITLFDSTGMALQDLAAAQVALRVAMAAGRTVELPA